jgi:hypothetical protein
VCGRWVDALAELSIGNVVRRVLSIIREEYLACQYQENQDEGSEEIARVLDPHSSPALYKMLGHDRDEVYTEPYDIKAVVQTSVGELIDEINNLYRNIADQVLRSSHTRTHRAHTRRVRSLLISSPADPHFAFV